MLTSAIDLQVGSMVILDPISELKIETIVKQKIYIDDRSIPVWSVKLNDFRLKNDDHHDLLGSIGPLRVDYINSKEVFLIIDKYKCIIEGGGLKILSPRGHIGIIWVESLYLIA